MTPLVAVHRLGRVPSMINGLCPTLGICPNLPAEVGADRVDHDRFLPDPRDLPRPALAAS